MSSASVIEPVEIPLVASAEVGNEYTNFAAFSTLAPDLHLLQGTATSVPSPLE